MSHWADIKTQISDLESLRLACMDCGSRLEVAARGQKLVAAGYGSNRVECDAKIVIPGCNYEVALIREASGAYGIKAEFWGTHGQMVSTALGQDCKKLLHNYGVRWGQTVAKRAGLSSVVQKLADGSTVVRMRGVSL